MNILFLNLPDPPGMYVSRDYCGGFGSAFPLKKGSKHNAFPPIFDAYAASVLEKEGHKANIMDMQIEKMSDTQLLENVRRVNPEVIVSRICLPSFGSDLRTIAMIKTRFPNIFCIGWGSICKVKPNVVLSKSNLDVVVRDELEFVIPNLIEVLMSEGKLDEVEGISFKTSAKIIHNPAHPFEKNLDALPLPAYHLLDMKKYEANESYFFPEGSRNKAVNFFTLLSSRGCNFNCLYCPYPVIFGPWRAMSPKRIVSEMEFLVKKYGVKTFWFHDQVFTMIPKRVRTICDEIINRKLDVTWACETHIKKLPRQLVRKMKEAGCTRIQVGVETGDPQLLVKVGKRGCTVEEVEKAIHQLREEGILVEANFIIGLPGENWDTIRNTAKMIKKTKPDDVAISMITPYPGTELFAIAKEKKWLITDDWNKYTTSRPVMALPDFSGEDMREAQRYLYGVFLYTSRLYEIVKAAKDHMFMKSFKKLVKNVPEIGLGAYLVVRSKLCAHPKN